MILSRVGDGFGASFDQAAVLSLVVFLFWGHLPPTVVTSIPLAVTLYLLFRYPGEVMAALRDTGVVWGFLIIGFGLSTVFSELPVRSVKGVFDFLRGMIVLVPVHWAMRHHARFLASMTPNVLVLSIFLNAGIFFVAWMSGDLHQQRQVLGNIFNQYNNFGTGAGILCLAAGVFSWHMWGRSRLMGGLFGALAAVSLGLVLLSGSRGSLLSTAVGLGALLCLIFRQYLWKILGAGLVCTASLLYAFKMDVLGNWVPALARPGDFSSYRFDMYSALLSDWWHYGRYFGLGPNTYKYLDYGQVLNVRQVMPHNIYLEAFTSLGLIGFSLLLIGIWALLVKVESKKNFLKNQMSILGITLLVFFLSRGMTDLKFWSTYLPGELFLCFGLIAFIGKNNNNLEDFE